MLTINIRAGKVCLVIFLYVSKLMISVSLRSLRIDRDITIFLPSASITYGEVAQPVKLPVTLLHIIKVVAVVLVSTRLSLIYS